MQYGLFYFIFCLPYSGAPSTVVPATHRVAPLLYIVMKGYTKSTAAVLPATVYLKT